MNYITITIKEEKLGLKFGMASFRYLQDKFVSGKTFIGNELNEIGIAHIIYSGYYNNCLVKEVDVKYDLEYFIDWIEQNISNNDVLESIKEVISVWSSNEFIRPKQDQVANAKKKNSRGKK
jgi:hypothetical protein